MLRSAVVPGPRQSRYVRTFKNKRAVIVTSSQTRKLGRHVSTERSERQGMWAVGTWVTTLLRLCICLDIPNIIKKSLHWWLRHPPRSARVQVLAQDPNSSFLPMQQDSGRQWRWLQELGSSCPCGMWEIQTELLALNPLSPGCWRHLGNEPPEPPSCSLPFLLTFLFSPCPTFCLANIKIIIIIMMMMMYFQVKLKNKGGML